MASGTATDTEVDLKHVLRVKIAGGLGARATGSLQRSGSAPPLTDDGEGPFSSFCNAWAEMTVNGDHGWGTDGFANCLPREAERDLAALSDPSYVDYYYSNKNINPRLPPPRPGPIVSSGWSSSAVRDLQLPPQRSQDAILDQRAAARSLFSHSSSPRQGGTAPAARDSSRLQDSSSCNARAPDTQGKGLMGLSPLSTRPGKSLLSEATKNWDGDYSVNPSSPVFGDPSSPFAPGPLAKTVQDDAVLHGRPKPLSARGPSGLGFGSAPGTPTKRSGDTLSCFCDDSSSRFMRHSHQPSGASALSSTLSDMGDAASAAAVGDPSMQDPLKPMSIQELAAVQVAEQLTQTQVGEQVLTSGSASPSCLSPMRTPKTSQDSCGLPAGAYAADLLPSSVYGPGSSPPKAGLQPFGGQQQQQQGAASGPQHCATQVLPASLPQVPPPDSASAQAQQLQAQAAVAMSMMYPGLYAQPGMQAAALAQANAMYPQNGAFGGLGMGFPAISPALLLHVYAQQQAAAGGMMAGGPQAAPVGGAFPQMDMAAYHQQMMDLYASATGGSIQGTPLSAMAAMSSAPDLSSVNMATAAYAAANGIPFPQHCMGLGAMRPNYADAESGRGKGKDAVRRDVAKGQRGKTDKLAAEKAESCNCALLEQLKGSKGKKIELPDIIGHVMEFCTDQNGSRFIQLKLESCPPEDTIGVFQEILPQAIALMTDVFGNYVIQKFFEHGSEEQRDCLAGTLRGNVLSLSLQMYGCRVVQKALEVLGIDWQRMIVAELDGNVTRCVRDQNGNHVIQKCIECVPTPDIAFMIDSFKGQVVVMSAHPYGCRVVQRILEHCTDESRLRSVMAEVLGATSQLAQDQYGNYVVQHVLERGSPSDRTTVINQLAGHIVELSQHKFASNVVEKCLQHGSHPDKQILVAEIMGHSEENGPLQIMMKDQFGNYVVQKLFEVCDDHQREQLLARIKNHLHNLKKFTYGKHIVARVEKLVTNTQRMMKNSTAHLSVADAELAKPPSSGTSPDSLPGVLSTLAVSPRRRSATSQ